MFVSGLLKLVATLVHTTRLVLISVLLMSCIPIPQAVSDEIERKKSPAEIKRERDLASQAEEQLAAQVTYERMVGRQVSSGLEAASTAKAAINEYFRATSKLPVSNATAGIAEPHEIQEQFVNSITIVEGAILVEFGGASVSEISGRTLELRVSISDDTVIWTCSSAYIDPRFLPLVCKE